MDIIPVQTAVELDEVRTLFEEYWSSFGFTPCFQNFGAELEGLPGAYAPPHGRLVIARVDGKPAGCIALRPFQPRQCEAKRLYVRPQFRGHGLGRALMQWVISEAKREGYSEMVGDTMPVMGQALAMYDQMGFERIGPYAENPTPGAIFLRLRL
jgi:putative acetyltransferase